jgi:hypothetical protein
MTSFPEFGESTTATEVANAFSEQVQGKNGNSAPPSYRLVDLLMIFSPNRGRQSQKSGRVHGQSNSNPLPSLSLSSPRAPPPNQRSNKLNPYSRALNPHKIRAHRPLISNLHPTRSQRNRLLDTETRYPNQRSS